MLKGLLLLLLCASWPAFAAVYKWVDDEGVVHFSDQPHPAAEKIELRPPTVYSPPEVTKPEEAPPQEEKAVAAVSYKSFSISQPQNDETIRSNEGTVNVSIAVQPALQEGHKIRLYVDGRQLKSEFKSTQMALQNMERGSHSVRAELLDEKGKKLAATGTVTFFLRKVSILHPKPK